MQEIDVETDQKQCCVRLTKYLYQIAELGLTYIPFYVSEKEKSIESADHYQTLPFLLLQT